jgi:hypothetical protein
MKQTQKSLALLIGSGFAAGIAMPAACAVDNPFGAKLLPQGYMVLAENTLPEPSPSKAISTNVINPQVERNVSVKSTKNQLTNIKSSKAQDGGCGAGSCAAKLNKAKGQNAVK